MEDSVIESEKTLRPLKLEVRERDVGDDEEDVEREKRQKLETSSNGVGGGLLDNLISKLASPRTPSKPTTNNDDHHVFDAENHHEEAPARDSDDVDGGGVDGEGSRGGGSGGGGVINNIISLFHKGSEANEGEDVKKNTNATTNEEEVEGERGEGEMINKVDQGSENGNINGSSSFISNLVPEGPAADEASILIHSVVHD